MVTILDAGAYSAYILSKLIKNIKITCEEIERKDDIIIYKCSSGDFTFETTEPVIKILSRFATIVNRSGKRVELILDPQQVNFIKKVAEKIANICKNEECYVTPDIGISTGKMMYSPFEMFYNNRPLYENKRDIWNMLVRECLKELNAKILFDRKMAQMIGTKKYENILEKLKNFFGKENIYTDEEGKIKVDYTLIFKSESPTGKKSSDIVTVKANEGLIVMNGEIIDHELQQQEVYNVIQNILSETYGKIHEGEEAYKTIWQSEREKGKLKILFRGKGFIDAYLRAVQNAKVITNDIGLKLKFGVEIPAGKNITLLTELLK